MNIIQLHRAVVLDEPTEMDNEVPLREEFPAPERTAEDDAYRARVLRWVLAIDLAALVAFAGLIGWARG